jgi:hypothetical protein
MLRPSGGLLDLREQTFGAIRRAKWENRVRRAGFDRLMLRSRAHARGRAKARGTGIHSASQRGYAHVIFLRELDSSSKLNDFWLVALYGVMPRTGRCIPWQLKPSVRARQGQALRRT